MQSCECYYGRAWPKGYPGSFLRSCQWPLHARIIAFRRWRIVGKATVARLPCTPSPLTIVVTVTPCPWFRFLLSTSLPEFTGTHLGNNAAFVINPVCLTLLLLYDALLGPQLVAPSSIHRNRNLVSTVFCGTSHS